MIKPGQKVKFNPWKGLCGYGDVENDGEVTGTVVLVHPAHHWFGVEYRLAGQPFRISFHFSDIWGSHKNVKIVK